MGRVAQMSVVTTDLALQEAGLAGNSIINSGKTGVAYGSSSGSITALKDFYSLLVDHNVEGINATTYIKMMSFRMLLSFWIMSPCRMAAQLACTVIQICLKCILFFRVKA